MGVTIKELSERSGVKIPTIRYYERQGLLPEPERTGTGQRRYGSVDVARLRLVRLGRKIGLYAGEIRALIEMIGEGNGEEIVVLAEAVSNRAERMRVFCVGLQLVSADLITGECDEQIAFDRLVGGEQTQTAGHRVEPTLADAYVTEHSDHFHELHLGSSEIESAGPTAIELTAQETVMKPASEKVSTQLPPFKLKRKRTRAKS